MPNTLTTRFAPSPTGHLHLGHAYSAWLNHDAARGSGGRFILRIEDIDLGRCRPEFEQAIVEDLAWLGLTWDGPIWRQSERIAHYEAVISDLAGRGLVYRCFKTRAELSALASAPHGPEPTGSVTAPLSASDEAELLDEGRAFAWRLHVQEALLRIGQTTISAQLQQMDGDEEEVTYDLRSLADPVLARKDFPTSYHLASVVDDAAQGVSLVWRGTDLEEAVPIHRLLQSLLDLPVPSYRHHDLVKGPDGKRLAKRDKSQTLRALQQAGCTPLDLKQQLGLPIGN